MITASTPQEIMRIFGRFIPPRRHNNVPTERSGTNSGAAQESASRTATENDASGAKAGAPGENQGRAIIARFGQFGTVVLHDQHIPDSDNLSPEKRLQRERIRAAVNATKVQGRGASALPDNLCAELHATLPAAIHARFEEEMNPGGFLQLSTDDRRTVIAIMMTKYCAPSRPDPDALLIAFGALLASNIEQGVATAVRSPLERFARIAQPPSCQDTLDRIGRKHPYHGKPHQHILNDLGKKIDDEVTAHTPKVLRLNRKMKLERQERNALTAIVLASHPLTRDLSLMDLLNFYRRFSN